MSLLDEYQAGMDSDFLNLVVAAMAQKAANLLKTTDSSSPKYKMYVRVARKIFSSDNIHVKFIGRALASFGMTKDTPEAQLINVIDNEQNFDIIAKLFDPEVDLEEPLNTSSSI